MALLIRHLLMVPLACSLALACSSVQACERHLPSPQALSGAEAPLSQR